MKDKSIWSRISEVAVGTLVASSICFAFVQVYRELSQFKEEVEKLRQVDIERRYSINQLTQVLAEQQEVLAERGKAITDLLIAIKTIHRRPERVGGPERKEMEPPASDGAVSERLDGLESRGVSTDKRMERIQMDIQSLRKVKK